MDNETERLKDFVNRNEAYIESAEWVTAEIDIVIEQYEKYIQTGTLPKHFETEECMYKRMLELDSRAAVEERVFNKLKSEQQDLLDG